MTPATLGQAQRVFAQTFGLFIVQLFNDGYEVTIGEVWRSDTEARLLAQSGQGVALSNHRLRLAGDLNIFKDGIWLQEVEQLRPVGEMWKALHPLARWGGDFTTRPDSDHYSFEWQGVQ